MKTEYNVIILILTDNNADVIEPTILSVVNQTSEETNLKIVVVDNNSKDGTYEKLLSYVKKYDISVYRLNKKYIKTRLMHQANKLLQYTLHRYITILSPGDILASDFIEKATYLLDNNTNNNARVLICEADIISQDGKLIRQKPLYESDCLLKKNQHFIDLLVNGLGHKIQCIYRVGTIPNLLDELTHVVDFTDCFKKAFFLIENDFIYVKDSHVQIRKNCYKDPLEDLLFRWYFIVRLTIYRDTIQNNSTLFLEPLSTKPDIYQKLSRLALEYAQEAAERGNSLLVRKILLFIEMVNSEIPADLEYDNLNRYLAGLSDL